MLGLWVALGALPNRNFAEPPLNGSGVIAVDTIWCATNGPFAITTNITVNPGVTLAIESGATIYFGLDVNLIVANGGRLLAEGTTAAPIRSRTGRSAFTGSSARQRGDNRSSRNEEFNPPNPRKGAKTGRPILKVVQNRRDKSMLKHSGPAPCRSGVSTERRQPKFSRMAALCRGAATTSRFMGSFHDSKIAH